MKTVRAAWRLAAGVVHALHGGAICAFVFPFLTAAARMQRVQWWSATMLERMGIAVSTRGNLAPAPVLLLANHVSWLDILAINALQPVRFVSKADVRRWPLLGFLVASGGTLFIEREKKRDALRVVHQVAAALEAGVTVAVFPEGTTGAGRQLLPFHANLLQAAIRAAVPLQPVALHYAEAGHAFSPAVEFLGATTLLSSVWRVARAEALVVHLEVLPVLETAGGERRGLATAAQGCIQGALDAAVVAAAATAVAAAAPELAAPQV